MSFPEITLQHFKVNGRLMNDDKQARNTNIICGLLNGACDLRVKTIASVND